MYMGQMIRSVTPTRQKTARLAVYKTQFKCIGAFLLTFGLSCIIIDTAHIVILASDSDKKYGVTPLDYAAPGIWAGAFFLVAGSLGVASGVSQSHCNFVSCMAMSILSSIAAIPFIAIEVIQLVDLQHCFHHSYCGDQYAYYIAIHATLGTLAFVGFVLSITLSGHGCSATCCNSWHIETPVEIVTGRNMPQHQQQPPQQQPQNQPQPQYVNQGYNHQGIPMPNIAIHVHQPKTSLPGGEMRPTTSMQQSPQETIVDHPNSSSPSGIYPTLPPRQEEHQVPEASASGW